MNKNTIQIIPEEKCVGCGVCESVCPKKAICMRSNDEGFSFPRLDDARCVSCGKCLKTCIANPELEINTNKMQDAFIVWSNNKKVRINSTSGGVYYTLAKYFIDNGGYICGCAYDDDQMGASHIIGNDINTLAKTARSKYIQSEIKGIYPSIKRLLDTGQKVLFVGTPCQVSALNKFLDYNYDNLVTCDFVCRGVNSKIAYQKYRLYLERKFNSKVRTVHFKNKKTGWNSLATHVYFENGRQYHGDKLVDPWINGFIVGHFYMRKSCYNCKYTNTNRCSDITFGDLWGYKGAKRDDLYQGISFLTTNTPKGKILFEAVKDVIEFSEIDILNIQEGNGCLNGALLDIPEERAEFFSKCYLESFEKLVYRLLRWDDDTIKNNKRNSIVFSLKNIIKSPKMLFTIHKIKERMEDVVDE